MPKSKAISKQAPSKQAVGKRIDPTRNFYELIDKKFLTDQVTYPNFKYTNIAIPSRICVLGSSGSCKTNWLMNFIAAVGVFDRITLYAKQLEEPLYMALVEGYKKLGKKLGITLIEAFDNLDNVIPSTDYDVRLNNLVIVDDFMNSEAKKLAPIIDMFSMGRKNNITTVYIAQDYFEGIPKKIRRNTNLLIIMKLESPSDMKRIIAEQSISKEHVPTLVKFLETIRKESIRNFLLIDKTTNDDSLKFRKNFDRTKLIV